MVMEVVCSSRQSFLPSVFFIPAWPYSFKVEKASLFFAKTNSFVPGLMQGCSKVVLFSISAASRHAAWSFIKGMKAHQVHMPKQTYIILEGKNVQILNSNHTYIISQLLECTCFAGVMLFMVNFSFLVYSFRMRTSLMSCHKAFSFAGIVYFLLLLYNCHFGKK